MDWLNIIVSILSGIAVVIPLVAKLVQYVKEAVQEKNWNQMLKLVMNLMEKAEQSFSDGAEKKQWVLDQLKAMADTLNYEIDYDVVGDMIDAMCDMARKVN